MRPLYLETPLLLSTSLSDLAGGEVWMKMECLQPSGSFKNRGMGTACRQAVQGGAHRLVCSSGGNAGLAVSYAGKQMGVPVTIVVPESTGERARQLIQRESAEVVVHGSAWDDAHQHALQLSSEQSIAYIHPFDDPLVWRGHSSLVDEVLSQGLTPEHVVLSVGGGGLFCGVMEGLDRHHLGAVPVAVLETEGTASLHQSLEAGELVELDRIASIATTLGARKVAPRALEYAFRSSVESLLVSDRQALDSCLRFADDHRILVEPACGAALAAIYEQLIPGLKSRKTLVIVCGGAGVTIQSLMNWEKALESL